MDRDVLPPTDKYAINRKRSVRQENLVLPGSKNPEYSLFPASLSHDRMIGRSKSPGNAGGLVGRHTLSCRKANQGGKVMPELFVGIDVAKDTSSAQGIDSNGKGQFSLTFAMDSEGFMQLWNAINENSRDLSGVLTAVESTACYHINLYSFLTAKAVSTVVINPLLIANFAKLSLRKTKTDKKDAMTIAQFLLMNRERISQLSLSQDLQDFRDIARERESVCNMLSSHKVEIKRLLQSTFPYCRSVDQSDAGVRRNVSLSKAGENSKAKSHTEDIAEERSGEPTYLYGSGSDTGCETVHCDDKPGKGAHTTGQGKDASASARAL
jgi:hypothetical protein